MDRTQRWKLADELTVYQIALLIAGYDPSEFEKDQYYQWPEIVKNEISPYLNAVKNAARAEKISMIKYTEDGYNSDDIDWNRSVINVDSLIAWMRSRNFVDGFFISESEEIESISNKNSEFYAPKLAAAVRAWKEVTSNPDALKGRTPKKALEMWLREYADEYGLSNKDSLPNQLGIEEVCKVANWKPGGGVSPTPGQPSAEAKTDAPTRGRIVRPRPTTPPKPGRSDRQPNQSKDDDIPV